MSKLIYICDDDLGILDVSRIVLSEKGYQVVPFENTTQFYLELEKNQPHLVIMDLWMPDHGGAAVTKVLKSDSKTKHIPIVILSANKDTAEIAAEAGADKFLQKPFDIYALEELVAQLLESK